MNYWDSIDYWKSYYYGKFFTTAQMEILPGKNCIKNNHDPVNKHNKVTKLALIQL